MDQPSLITGAAMQAGSASPLRPSRLAHYLPVAVILVPLTLLVLAGAFQWRATVAAAKGELTRAADAGAEYAERALESFAALAGRVNDGLREFSDDEIRLREGPLHQELRRLVGEVMRSHVAFVLDSEGFPLVSSDSFPVPRIPLAAAEYRTGLAALNPDETYVSAPFFGPFDGELNFAISRRRQVAGGSPAEPESLAGTVVVTVRPDALADGFRRISGPLLDTLALVRPDGIILTRSTGQTSLLPPVRPESGFHDVVRSGAAAAVYGALNIYGNQPSLAAARRLEGWPVYATSRRPRADLVAQWRSIMGSHLLFGLPATLGLLALSLRVRRDQLRLAGVNSRLETAVETSLDRLTRADRFGLGGTFEFDLRTGVNIRSREYMAIHGLPQNPERESHADWVRRLHPDDRERAEGYLLHAISDESGMTAYSQTYRIILPDGGIRWIAAGAEIERDREGRAVMMRGAHVDVTPLRTTELALAESDARLRLTQEALEIGTWEWVRSTRKLSWSVAMMRLWGFDPAAGQPDVSAALERVHPADRRRFTREMAQALSSGRLRSEFRVIRPGVEGQPETIWIVLRAKLIPLPGSLDARFLGVAYDATERKQAEERAAMLAHEVEHRAKNALTLVGSLLRMTSAETVEEFAQVMEGRVGALARTMALLGRQRWTGAMLGQIISEELAPFGVIAGGASEILLSGPDIMLRVDIAQPVSMALHELATNAAKYGALSVPQGRLDVSWSLRDGMLQLLWQEAGEGQEIGPPLRESFGTRLIDSIFEGQLGGTITRHWQETGLVCEITFPLETR